jgi:RHH-type proline utilization regulon transcriptional repressor/proline dehydrogenase/delta 1-pyrroline-5-carboxylate dehydrogenase
VFGPVLHLLRYRREALDALLDDIDATGYGLTFGVHSRIDETIAHVTARSRAGNIYVNRNLIGAVVGAQPFGGHGLSGTGPKAGGPLYLLRLLAAAPPVGDGVRGTPVELPGPAGERNVYTVAPRGAVLCAASAPDALGALVGAALGTGNRAVVPAAAEGLLGHLPAPVRDQVRVTADAATDPVDAVLVDGDDATVLHWTRAMARRDGPIVPVLRGAAPGWLVRERVVSTNTAAAGGNASLMSIG